MHLFFKNKIHRKLKTIVTLFVYIFYLTYTQSHLYAFGEELKLPDIPPRPSMKELLKSLDTESNIKENTIDQKVQQSQNISMTTTDNINNQSPKIKSLTNNQNEKKIKPKLKAFKDIYKKGNDCDIASEKLFKIPSNKVFSLLLDTAKLLNFSLKSFDTLNNEIIVTDRFKNKIIMHITSVEESKSKVNIIGYSSILYHGKQGLESNIKKLIDVLSKNEKS